jgi:hypothetical protein
MRHEGDDIERMMEAASLLAPAAQSPAAPAAAEEAQA